MIWILGALIVIAGLSRVVRAKVGRSDAVLPALRRAMLKSPTPVVLPADVDVWGVVVDTTTAGGTMTVTAMFDGGCSYYVQHGTGALGTPAIGDPAKRAVADAPAFLPLLGPGNGLKLPKVEQTQFTLLTRSGPRTKTVSSKELQQTGHPLLPLWMRMFEVFLVLRDSQKAPDAK